MKNLNSKLFEKSQVSKLDQSKITGGEYSGSGMGGDGKRYHEFCHDDGELVYLPAEPMVEPVHL
jgi:hypothetical protein